MLNAIGQCLQCGHRNADGSVKCARCEAAGEGSHEAGRQYQSALPWIAMGALALVFGLTMLTRQNPAGPVAPAAPGAFVASASEPPAEEVLISPSTSNGPAPSAPASVSGIQGQWREIVRLEGNGAKRTPAFSVAARHWRIRWAASANQDPNGWIYGIIYRASGKSVGMALNGKGQSGGVTRLQGRGSYYIEVKSTQNWSMQIEQWH